MCVVVSATACSGCSRDTYAHGMCHFIGGCSLNTLFTHMAWRGMAWTEHTDVHVQLSCRAASLFDYGCVPCVLYVLLICMYEINFRSSMERKVMKLFTFFTSPIQWCRICTTFCALSLDRSLFTTLPNQYTRYSVESRHLTQKQICIDSSYIARVNARTCGVLIEWWRLTRNLYNIFRYTARHSINHLDTYRGSDSHILF